jgi:hypothetical protein
VRRVRVWSRCFISTALSACLAAWTGAKVSPEVAGHGQCGMEQPRCLESKKKSLYYEPIPNYRLLIFVF